jgi:hypothetical protein
VIGAMRSSDREGFANLFARSIILCLQLPPDSENGLDPKVLKEELLASIRTSARDLAHREEFTNPRLGAGGRKSLLLFTQQARVERFVQAHASMVSG